MDKITKIPSAEAGISLCNETGFLIFCKVVLFRFSLAFLKMFREMAEADIVDEAPKAEAGILSSSPLPPCERNEKNY